MKRAIISLICVLAAAAGVHAVFAPDSGEEEMAVFLMSDKAETCIQVQAGTLFAVRFQSSPGTGYSWALAAELDKKLVEFLEEKMDEPGSGLLGGRETVTWTFRALACGETEIAMGYARPWEKDAPPARTHVFKLTIR